MKNVSEKLQEQILQISTLDKLQILSYKLECLFLVKNFSVFLYYKNFYRRN
jgi:hypothetical protein